MVIILNPKKNGDGGWERRGRGEGERKPIKMRGTKWIYSTSTLEWSRRTTTMSQDYAFWSRHVQPLLDSLKVWGTLSMCDWSDIRVPRPTDQRRPPGDFDNHPYLRGARPTQPYYMWTQKGITDEFFGHKWTKVVVESRMILGKLKNQ